MYRKIYSHANSIRVMMMMMMPLALILPRGAMILVTKTSDQTRQRGVSVCVCLAIPFILDVRFVDVPTGSHKISPPSFCGACLNFFSREGFRRSVPSSTVKSNFVY